MADPMGSGSGGGAQDPFEMFRRLWAPLGLPVPGMSMPTLDPAEVDKRIADLKSVETWLGMNLNMVKMAIQGLEIQKVALDAMKANAGAASNAA
ncbi:MAG: PhaM family polyhydroxyalkanoate granule multifunctional regulatory protein, partial [Betaproteobacteria bacterium]